MAMMIKSMILDIGNGRKEIGYWWNEYEPDLPNPEDFMDPIWNKVERNQVIKYLKGGKQGKRMKGSSACRICKKSNGSGELFDSKYTWPEGFAHYLEAHDVRVPVEFVEWVCR